MEFFSSYKSKGESNYLSKNVYPKVKYFICFISFVVLLSCHSPERPLSDDQMVDLLTDMLIADELLVKYAGHEPKIYRDSVKMLILSRYDLPVAEFDSIMLNVQKDLLYYHGIQELVATRLDSLKKASDEK